MTSRYIHRQGSLRLLQKAKLLTSRDQPFLGSSRLQARALTLNNLGCLMKKWGKPREGVKLLARALRIEAEIPGSADNPAGTHVNMSAALSTLGLHRAAAAHAGHAVGLASRAIMEQETEYSSGGGSAEDADDPGSAEERGNASSTGDGGAGGNDADGCGSGDDPPTATGPEGPESSSDSPPAAGKDGETIDSAVADDGRSPEAPSSSPPPSADDADRGTSDQPEAKIERDVDPDKTADHGGPPPEGGAEEADASSVEKEGAAPSSAAGGLLAIAYFNLGVEREHLGQLEAAISAYEEARVVADQHLGPESPVAKGIQVALEKASDAVVAAASYSGRRAALRSRLAVSSFPCIGKLQFGQRTPDGVSSFGGGGRLSPRRRLQHHQHQQHQHGDETASESRVRDLLDRAYASPRPCPARRGVHSACHGPESAPSPRSPTTAPGSATGGPQRAGRWTKTCESAAVRPARSRGSGRGDGEPSGRSDVDTDLRWRAMACAEWQCSPREALHAQQIARRS